MKDIKVEISKIRQDPNDDLDRPCIGISSVEIMFLDTKEYFNLTDDSMEHKNYFEKHNSLFDPTVAGCYITPGEVTTLRAIHVHALECEAARRLTEDYMRYHYDTAGVPAEKKNEYTEFVPALLKQGKFEKYYYIALQNPHSGTLDVSEAVTAESRAEAEAILRSKVPEGRSYESYEVGITAIALADLIKEQESGIRFKMTDRYVERHLDPEQTSVREYNEKRRTFGKSGEDYYTVLKEENKIQVAEKIMRHRLGTTKITLAEFDRLAAAFAAAKTNEERKAFWDACAAYQQKEE